MKVKCITKTIIIGGISLNQPSLQIGKEYTLPNEDENYWIMSNKNWSVWVEEESRWIPATYFVSLEDWKKEWRDKQLIELGI